MNVESILSSTGLDTIAGSLIVRADCGTAVISRIDAFEERPGCFRFTVVATLPDRTQDAAVRLTPAFAPSFRWIFHLTPEDGYVADMHVFRSPAIIIAGEGKRFALVPDLEGFDNLAARLYMDMNAQEEWLEFGQSNTEISGHVLFKKSPNAQFGGSVEFRFYILVDDQIESSHFRFVLQHLWQKYGAADFARIKEASLSKLATQIDRTYCWAFESWRDIVWQDIMLDGKTVGAPAFIVITRQSPNYKGTPTEREVRSVWNQAWFCSLRSASGLFRYARRHDRADLMELANRTKELALSFPQVQGGLFYSVIATEMEEFESEGRHYKRSKGWDTYYFGNSDRNPFGKTVREAPFHILDMSFTAYYMLLWHIELEADLRLASFARRYADKLCSLQRADGFFPAWIGYDGIASDVLSTSLESAMSAVFLFTCARIFGQEAYRDAALRCVEAAKAVIEEGRYEDFETYWSCSNFWSDRVGQKIPRNGIYKQCNLSMFYGAWAMLEAFRETKQEEYLRRGCAVLDELLMTQASWQPPYMRVPVVGGFGVMNADAEWVDARQSLFAELIMQYGVLTGEAEYMERSLAAICASFVTMYCPENPEMMEQWQIAWPFFGEQDFGFSMENYGHIERTDAKGLGLNEFTIYDWGNGAAAEAVLRMMDHNDSLKG